MSSSWKAAASTLAGTAQSPWSTLFASTLDFLDTYTQTATGALFDNEVTVVNAQAGIDASGNSTGDGEIGLAAALRDDDLAAANADYQATLGTSATSPTPIGPIDYPGLEPLPDTDYGLTVNVGGGPGDGTSIYGVTVPDGALGSYMFSINMPQRGSDPSGVPFDSIEIAAPHVSTVPEGKFGLAPPLPVTTGSADACVLPLDEGTCSEVVLGNGAMYDAANEPSDDQPLLELATKHDARVASTLTTEAVELLEGRDGPALLPAPSFEERQAAASAFLNALGFPDQSAPTPPKAPPPTPGTLTLQTPLGPLTWTEVPDRLQPSEAEKRAAEARTDAKLGLFAVARGLQRAQLEREIANLKIDGGSREQIEQLQQMIDKDYKYTQPIRGGGNHQSQGDRSAAN